MSSVKGSPSSCFNTYTDMYIRSDINSTSHDLPTGKKIHSKQPRDTCLSYKVGFTSLLFPDEHLQVHELY